MVLVAGRFFTLAVFLPPFPEGEGYPPRPPSRREGGESRLFHARGFAPCIPATEPARHWEMGANQAPGGGVPSLPPANPTFSFVSCPYPPCPPSRREGGRFLVYFVGGFAPGTPALDRLRHLQNLPSGCPAQRGSLCFGAKQTEPPFFGQCRQPRRGGTGGEELRRLRWSSPPGQGEQVLLGFSPPAGHHSGKVSRRPTGTSPLRARGSPPAPVPLPAQTRGCKGRSPLHKKTKKLPLPHRGRALCERGLGG